MTQIRRARADDAPAIQSLYRQLVGHPDIRVHGPRIERAALDANTALLVADDQGTVLGSTLLSLCMDVMFGDQPFAVLENLIVDTDCRGKGVGRALIGEAERIATAHQCSKLMLLSSASRRDAHRFFERLGYRSGAKQGFVKFSRDFDSRP